MTKLELEVSFRIDPAMHRVVKIYTEDGPMHFVEVLREMFIEDQNHANGLTDDFQDWYKDEQLYTLFNGY
jgi:hypothetical protein